LRSTVETAARQVFGKGKVDPALVDRIVSGFQSVSLDAQKKDYDNQATGGNATAPPSAETYVTDKLRTANPGAAGAGDAVGLYNFFVKLWDGRTASNG
jgi:hypothetical protein